MKILRKRVGSFFIDRTEDDYYVKDDSIFKNNEIVFNFLPIKNLLFFNLNFKKSSIEKKCWVYLDLNLNKLYDFIIEGNFLTSREILFEMINGSFNKNKKLDINEIYQNLNEKIEYNLDNLKKIDFDKRMKLYDKKFVKFGKIFFELEKKLITVNKCKMKTIKIPNFIILNNYYEISIYDSLLNIFKNEQDNENIVIISNSNDDVLNKLFLKNNGSNYIKFKSVVNSEDLNHQMNNYYKNIISKNKSSLNDFLEQLNFESKNFFYRKKNIFILCKNLNEYSYSYLSNCQFDNIFILNSLKIKKNLKIILKPYNDYRIDYKQNNYIASQYILLNNIFKLEVNDKFKIKKYEINDFPLEDWKKISDSHLMNLCKKNKQITNFIKIGKKYEWNLDSINKLEIIESENIKYEKKILVDKCPISMSELNSFSIKTCCQHKFNMKGIIEWLSEKNECPICRTDINCSNFEFNFFPNLKNIFEQIKNNKNWIIVIDKIWNQYFNLADFEGKIIKQSELSNKSINKFVNSQPSNYEILNLTSLNNLDIKFLLGINIETCTTFVELTEK